MGTPVINVPVNDKEINAVFMQAVLNRHYKNIVVTEVKAERGTKPGDNFSSDLYRAYIKATFQNKPFNKSYIIKLGSNDGSRGNIQLEAPIYLTEISAYETFLPVMQEFAKNVMDSPFPICINTGKDEVAGFVVLDDLKPDGYILAKSPKFVQTLDETRAAMKAYAKLHALGYKFKFSHMGNLQKDYPILSKNFFTENKKQMSEIMEASTEATVSIVSKLLPQYQDKLESLQTKTNNLDKFYDLANPRADKVSTIIHGDTNSNNSLFKYNGDVVVDCKLVDFELSHLNHPLNDVIVYIYSNTSPQFRKQHVHELLYVYHQELLKYVKLLNISELTDDELSFSKLMKDYDNNIEIGIYMSLFFLPFFIIINTDVDSLYGGDVLENIKVACKKLTEQDPSQYKFVKERVEGIMEEIILLKFV